MRLYPGHYSEGTEFIVNWMDVSQIEDFNVQELQNIQNVADWLPGTDFSHEVSERMKKYDSLPYTNKIQQDATVCRYLLLQNYSTCFGYPSHPSSEVHRTVTAASGTGHIWATSFLQRGPHPSSSVVHRTVTAASGTGHIWATSFLQRGPHPSSSGVHRTVTAASGTGHSIWTITFLQRGQFCHVGGRLLLRFYDLYQRLQLQFYVLLLMGAGHVGGRLLLRYYDLYQMLQLKFYVLLMMGAMDTRNM